jgi:hypothetical protein
MLHFLHALIVHAKPTFSTAWWPKTVSTSAHSSMQITPLFFSYEDFPVMHSSKRIAKLPVNVIHAL